MLVELRIRRIPPKPPDNSPVDGIRILALLPKEWRKDLRQTTGDIVIRVQTNDLTTNSEVRTAVVELLADPMVGHWELMACDTLAVGPSRAHHE